MKTIIPLVFALAMLGTSCTESKTNTEEKKEINVMDSTEKVVKEKVEKLEDQTKKVEESLDKLDKEFDSSN